MKVSNLPKVLRQSAVDLGKVEGQISVETLDRAVEKLGLPKDELVSSGITHLRTFLQHNAGEINGSGYSSLSLRSDQLGGNERLAQTPLALKDSTKPDACSELFSVPRAERDVADKQSVVVPLQPGKLHVIELKYQDTRKLRDLEFNYREGGGAWKTVRGDEFHALEEREKTGEVQIKRENDHNSPWINNPVRVKVEVLYPDGRTHNVGTKFLDFHVHDAHSADSSGYAETDNISNGYENLSRGKLPEGSLLRLTPMHQNRKPWEKSRTTAMQLSWVKPTYLPDHKESKSIAKSSSFQLPKAEGYDVDKDRTIAAVLVNWTDEGGTSSGNVRVNGQASQRYNVGSGETELIPVFDKAKDGKLFVEGRGVKVRNIEVLYAD